MRTRLGGAVVVTLMATALPTCDASKAELEQSKAQVQTTTSERDSLRTQVATLQAQVATLQQQLGDANTKLSSAQGAQQQAVDAEKTAKERLGKANRSAVQERDAQRTKEQKDADEKMTGKNSMNN